MWDSYLIFAKLSTPLILFNPFYQISLSTSDSPNQIPFRLLVLSVFHPVHSQSQDIGFITHAQRVHSKFSTKSAID
jgi:hypothetical protein